jgi:hypothetical protein
LALPLSHGEASAWTRAAESSGGRPQQERERVATARLLASKQQRSSSGRLLAALALIVRFGSRRSIRAGPARRLLALALDWHVIEPYERSGLLRPSPSGAGAPRRYSALTDHRFTAVSAACSPERAAPPTVPGLG